MKILKVVYKDGEARFVVENYLDTTFCVDLVLYTTQKGVLDRLKELVDGKKAKDKEKEFDDLKLKKLEGTDI